MNPSACNWRRCANAAFATEFQALDSLRVPVGVGFGIRDAHNARQIAQVADAVVIGSWLIESLEGKPAADALAAASDLMRSVRRQLELDVPEQTSSPKSKNAKS